jgi:tetratricopeptide (TPR) repeat protein
MIVRNEERFLAECLASIAPVVDEIVVVDTGSTDASIAIAEAHGARVLRREWDGDFGAARNAALDAAEGEWILYIDADERLRPLDSDELQQRLRRADEVAFTVVFHPFVDSTPYYECRLWRHDPRIRFHGVIHEKHTPAIAEVSAADGRPVSPIDSVVIDHVGYEGDQTAKHHRNIPLLEAELAVDPANIFNWTHLGRAWAGLGEYDRANEALERAVDLERTQPGATDQGVAAFAELGRVRHAAGKDVGDLVAEGLARFPENWMLVWLKGHLDLDAGRYEEAVDCFRRLLTVDARLLPLTGVAYDARIFASWSQGALGLAYFRLGRLDEAAAAYAVAEALEPDNQEWTVKRRLAEARAGR